MQKNTITLAQVGSTILGEFTARTIDGYSPDNDTALIVHKDPTGAGWNIGHKCGYAVISHIRTRSAALKAATELGWLANWHNITIENALGWYEVNKEAMLKIKAEALTA